MRDSQLHLDTITLHNTESANFAAKVKRSPTFQQTSALPRELRFIFIATGSDPVFENVAHLP